MRNWVDRLSREAIVYGVGRFVSGSFSVFLIPAYTRLLSVEQYGQLEMVIQFQVVLATLTLAGTDTALGYHFFQDDESPARQRRLVSARLQFEMCFGCLLSIVFSLAGGIVLQRWFHCDVKVGMLALACLALVIQLAMAISLEVSRLSHRPFLVVWISVLYTVCSGLLSIVLMVGLKWGLYGYFAGHLAGGLIAALVGWRYLRAFLDLSHLHFNECKQLVRTGLPMIPGSLATYALTNGEKFVISLYLGPGMLGLYAVAYRLASVITFGIDSFRHAFFPLTMEAIHSDNGPGLFRSASVVYLAVGSVVAMLLTGLVPLVGPYLLAKEYHEAYSLVGLLCWPFILTGLVGIVTPGIWRANRPWFIPVAATSAALLNMILCVFLVPRLGLIGAVWAALCSYVGWIVIAGLISEYLWPIRLPFSRLGLILMSGVSGTRLITEATEGRLDWMAAGGGVGVILLVLVLASRSDFERLFVKDG